MRRFDLIAFDIDGTLIHGPEGRTVWEVLNRRFVGSSDLNAEYYARVCAGSMTYAEWVALDVGGWRDAGATRDELIQAFEALKLIDGAREALEELRRAGCRLFAISGTLDLMLDTLFPDHPFEEVYANHIGFSDDGRISHWRATPFDMQGKAQALRAISLREEIPLARSAFVGDSSNDLWIARTAGTAIAFNPRCPELAAAARAVVHSNDLRDLLPHLL